jgi:acid phosphatase
MTPEDTSKWNSLQWRRRLERFGEDDGPIVAAGPDDEVDGICQFGELTDQGRQTTYDLGTRLRLLYVDQLKFMPTLISDADMIYLRATPIPRALESLQQTFWGMYPLTARTASFPPPTIVTRTPADETLFPNDSNCRRFAQLSRAFAQRTAARWNDTDDMEYLNKLIGKWMPQSSPKVRVDSHPRLSGIMDTINATLAHPKETRLPKEFYDDKARAIIDKIAVEEWFSGYSENNEYRKLGIGALVGDVVERMTSVVEGSGLSIDEIGGSDGKLGKGRGGEQRIKFALSGCHDTTLAAMLTSLGAFGTEIWPPYTSHIAVELFRKVDHTNNNPLSESLSTAKPTPSTSPGWLVGMLGLNATKSTTPTSIRQVPHSIARRPYSTLSPSEQEKLKNYYVRLRYNDKVMYVPGCKPAGKHLDGDESLCTLEAFKQIADSFTPRDWKGECAKTREERVDTSPEIAEWAGGATVGTERSGVEGVSERGGAAN